MTPDPKQIFILAVICPIFFMGIIAYADSRKIKDRIDQGYRSAIVNRVIDGDTVDLDVSLGFGVKIFIRARLARIDTPELRAKDPETRNKARDAKNFLKEILATPRTEITVRCPKKGKYGRWICTLYQDDIDINQLLLDKGYAKPYFH